MNKANPFKICLLLALLISCKSEAPESVTSPLYEAQFNPDSLLLATKPFIDRSLNISVNRPKDYMHADSTWLDIIKNQAMVSEYANASIVSAMQQSADSSMMIIFDISKVDNAYFDLLQSDYDSLLNLAGMWQQVRLDSFRHGCHRVDQYLLENQDVLNFRLVCTEMGAPDPRPNLELMYMINKRNVEENLKSVESSIASLNCLIQ